MIRLLIAMAASVAAGLCLAAADAFALPPGATAAVSNDKGGWQSSGTITLAFVQAQSRLATSIAASGWTHVHEIALGRERVLDTWRRGREELTVMVWRVSTGKSGFSYCVSTASGSAKRAQLGRRP